MKWSWGLLAAIPLEEKTENKETVSGQRMAALFMRLITYSNEVGSPRKQSESL